MPKYCLFGEGNGTPLLYSCLENPMDGGAWWATVHGVAKSQTRLSDFTFTFHFHALENEMATHSSVLAWRIPGTGEPGGLPSMGSHRVGHNWSDLAAAAAFALGEFFQSEDLCLFGFISFTNFLYSLRFLFGTPFRWWLEFKWSLSSTSLYLTFICSISGRSSAVWENSLSPGHCVDLLQFCAVLQPLFILQHELFGSQILFILLWKQQPLRPITLKALRCHSVCLSSSVSSGVSSCCWWVWCASFNV